MKKERFDQLTISECAKLHPKILDILFEHRREIAIKLSDIIGIHYIDHMAIIISNPKNEIVIFSKTPTIEYNLISSNLWLHDGAFSPQFFKKKSFFWWEEAYNSEYFEKIKNIKEQKHKYKLGFCLVRKINAFYIIYSFATRRAMIDSQSYYLSHKEDLLRMGDYCYRSIRNIYALYTTNH
jgi:hypothetical protein